MKRKSAKRFRLVCFLRIDGEHSELMTKRQAIEEKEQAELMQPENAYMIEEVDTD